MKHDARRANDVAGRAGRRFHLPKSQPPGLSVTVLGALAIAFSALASGCALTTMTLRPPVHADVTSARSVGGGREILLIVPFVDQRPTPARCGMKKNGYNVDTADINCSVPPNQWLATLVADELRAAGFRVTLDPKQASPAALRLDATLTQFFLEPEVGFATFSPEADIELLVVATSASGLDAKRNFYFKGRETALSGLEDNFRLAAESAVKEMLVGLVAALTELVKHYPQLGLPPRVAMSSTQSRVAEVQP